MAKNVKEEVFGTGFTVTTGNADDGQVGVSRNGVPDEGDCQPAADNFVGFDDDKREEKQGKRFEGEENDEDQVGWKRKKKNNCEIEKKGDGENEFCFRGMN